MIKAAIAALILATLPASGAISWSAIQTEFTGANPISLSEYYEGAGYVTAGSTQPNNIPTSGAISAWHFYGAAKVAGPLTASLSSSTSTGSCMATGGTCTASGPAVTCIASGGTPPYSYVWSFVTGSSMTMSGGTTATASWTKSCGWDSVGEVGRSYTGYYKCTVTDAVSATSATSNVTVLRFNDG